MAGYYDPRRRPDGAGERLAAAAQSLSHRGPDGQSVWAGEPGVGLAHARLAIIELSSAGDQPMLSWDGRYAIVFNGEIYNHAELRSELAAAGHRFASRSDTEVILEAYRAWGKDCARRFIGMFAFALWDKAERRMLLCRDPAGVKPLYYQHGVDGLFFGSELKALRVLRPDFDFSVDRQAIGQFLQYGYIPAPRSAYAGVRKVPPAHWLTVNADGYAELSRYWSLPEPGAVQTSKPESEILDELEALLVRSVKYRLVADVPIALFLSGGIDSSLVAAITSQRIGAKLTAYTIAFPDEAVDESDAARSVARHLGLEHIVSPVSSRELDELMRRWTMIYDEPFGDASGFPTHVVAELAARDYKVALSGDGGDELFGGYSSYLTLPPKLDAIGRVPLPVRRLASQAFSTLGRSSLLDLRSPVGRSLNTRFGGGALFDRTNRAASLLHAGTSAELANRFAAFWQPQEISRLLGIDYEDDPEPWPASDNGVDQLMRRDFGRYLPDDVLTKVDRATMAVGLESREPLLDRQLVEFAFNLPPETRLSSTHGKLLLRKLLARFLPDEICFAEKKGFAVPLRRWTNRWIAGGAWDELRADSWRAGGDLIDPRMMEGAYGALAGSAPGVNRLWLLLVLQNWCATWTAPARVAAPAGGTSRMAAAPSILQL